MMNFINDFPYDKYIAITLAAVFIGLAATYGVFLQQTIDNVVTRGHIEEDITQIRSAIGSAEKTYGTHIGAATLQQAKELGLKRVDGSQFITRSIDSNAFASANVSNQ